MYQAKHRIVPAMALTASLLLAACGTTTTDNMAADWSSVTDQEWNLVQVKDGAETLLPTPPVMATARFSEDGTVSGNAGCNQYSGSYEQAGSSLSVAQLVMTRKLCIAEEAMKVESAFSGTFVLVNSWDVNDGDLVLKNHNGNTVIKLTPATP